jgi:phosphocarrier protein HPr
VRDGGQSSIEVLVKNRKGLHARASAKFVRCAELFEAEVRVTKDGTTVGGTSIMGLMMLGASIGTTLHLEAEGVDAAAALAALRALVDDLFGEGE